MSNNQLAAEEIERNQNALRFKTETVQKEVRAIWKITNMRENWRMHFSGIDRSDKILFQVEEKGHVVKFEFGMCYQGEDMPGSFLLVLRPFEVPPAVRHLYGTSCIEFLDKDGNVWETFGNGPCDWLHSDEPDFFIEDLYCEEIMLPHRTLLSDQVLGEENSLTIRITFKQLQSQTREFPNVGMLEQQASLAVDPIMTTHMEALLKDTSNADIQLKMKDGEVILAHKLILSARSPVFKRMFEGDFMENVGIAEIPDLSSATMKILIHYVYTGKLHPDWKNDVGELLNGANKYDLQGVIQYCNHLMITLCNDFNAEDLLAIAKLHSLDRATGDIEKCIRGITI